MLDRCVVHLRTSKTHSDQQKRRVIYIYKRRRWNVDQLRGAMNTLTRSGGNQARAASMVASEQKYRAMHRTLHLYRHDSRRTSVVPELIATSSRSCTRTVTCASISTPANQNRTSVEQTRAPLQREDLSACRCRGLHARAVTNRRSNTGRVHVRIRNQSGHTS